MKIIVIHVARTLRPLRLASNQSCDLMPILNSFRLRQVFVHESDICHFVYVRSRDSVNSVGHQVNLFFQLLTSASGTIYSQALVAHPL